ncbi:TIGR04219 family outer membrane beta-barrel protein [Psychromonas sp.]|nr:TIGR04219 family outer membrane beta-barrel protein [Psychromonas sp.]
MKKQALTAAIIATISMPSMADFIGIYAGIDYGTNQTSLSNSSDSDNNSNLSGYLAFEHPIPVIPNIKLRYSDLSNNDISNDSSVMNGILYYEVFDNDLFEIDLGLTYTGTESDNKSADLGQVYGAAKLHIPGVGMYAFAEAIGGSITDDNALDVTGGLAYTFNPDSVLLNFIVRAGYRLQEIEFKNTPKQTNEGLFAGLEVHF